MMRTALFGMRIANLCDRPRAWGIETERERVSDMWNVEYWDEQHQTWLLGMTTTHRAAANQLVGWLDTIGWRCRVQRASAAASDPAPRLQRRGHRRRPATGSERTAGQRSVRTWVKAVPAKD